MISRTYLQILIILSLASSTTDAEDLSLPTMSNQMASHPPPNYEDLVQQGDIPAVGDDTTIGDQYCSRCRALDLEKMIPALEDLSRKSDMFMPIGPLPDQWRLTRVTG
jgi:hypothetical protein